jgi:ATP adenylyltransferase
MEFLWSPWRYDYVTASGKGPPTCVFCIGRDAAGDPDRLVVFRGSHNFVILNLFPYTSGHLMVAPYAHIASLNDVNPDQASEMMALAQRSVRALTALYRPEGFNVGLNLGQAAGAGVKDHLHMHVVARWVGDTNFMTVVGETRVLPEELSVTYSRLKTIF